MQHKDKRDGTDYLLIVALVIFVIVVITHIIFLTL